MNKKQYIGYLKILKVDDLRLNSSFLSSKNDTKRNSIIPLCDCKAIKIGRNEKLCEVIIKNITVSQVHFIVWTLKFNSESSAITFIRDVSKNGTFINKKKISKQSTVPLNNKDLIEIRNCVKFIYIQISKNFLFEQTFRINNWIFFKNKIGYGAFGSIFITYNEEMDKYFAVKTIKNTNSVSSRTKKLHLLKNEAKILLKIIHVGMIYTLLRLNTN